MEKSMFFNARETQPGVYDRVYQAEEFAAYFAKFIGNGVFPNPSTGLQVVQNSTPDMTTVLSAGSAYINGYTYINDAPLVFTHKVADGTLNRKDAIFIRFDKSGRAINAYKMESSLSTDPVTPLVVRTSDYYDLCVGVVNIKAGITKITQDLIEDTRMNKSVCGIVTGVVNQVDTTTLYNQIQSDLKYFKDVSQKEFDEWFADINAKLGTEPATALQSQVDDLQAAVGGMPLELSVGSNSVQITADENRLESVKVAGFTTQTGTGDPSPTNIRLIENAGADGTTFVDVNGQQTQIPLQAPLHEGDTLETNVVYNGAFKCVETHIKATVSVDGQTTLFTQDTNGYAVALPGAADGAVVCNAFSGLSASSQSVTIPASAFPSTVTNLETANTWAQSQNVVIEYPLSIPKVYADTSVPIDNPQGASTVSSEENTTLTVYIRSTKELQPLTVSLNGASQGQYNGETKQDINLVVTPQSIGALPKIKYTRYKFPDKQVPAQDATPFEATQAAMGIPDNGRVVSIFIESTGWNGLVPQHWSLNLGAKTVFVRLYNATQAEHTVGPTILAFYYEE